MSNALAIAGVTAVLKDLLENALIDHDIAGTAGPVTVTTRSPVHIGNSPTGEPDQLNLFLYQVSANPGWRNVGLPSRDEQGNRTSNPPLALDLRYLLTAYGATDLMPEILLGYAAQVLHETPVLTRDAIRTALGGTSPVRGTALPPPLNTLMAADLADQVEQVKITPHYLDSEEMSRIWSALEIAYRLSTAYQVSVVLIESRRSIKSPLPVRGYNLYPILHEQPSISELLSQTAANQPILRDQPFLPGQRLVIEGRKLAGDITVVSVGDTELVPGDVTESRVVVDLPTTLRPGIQGVQVIHRLRLGTPPEPHRGVESNVVPIVLRPVIVPNPAPPPDAAIVVAATNEPTGGLRMGTVTVTLTSPVGREQRTLLLVNRVNVPQGEVAHTYTFRARPWSPPTEAERTTIVFSVSGVAAGEYLVRVQVDGADSLLTVDVNGLFTSPRITI